MSNIHIIIIFIIKDTWPCDSLSACFFDCIHGFCRFVITWSDFDEEHMSFLLTYHLPDSGNHWIALGFSEDQRMVMKMFLNSCDLR